MWIDKRGYFREVAKGDIKQINMSFSKKGVVRGLHYQEPAVEKVVWVASGMILDVAFNLETGEVRKKILSGDTDDAFIIPKGWAHGFQALEDSIVCYGMDGLYNPKGDKGINPSIIEWPLKGIIISDKDRKAAKWLKQS